ILRQSRRSEAHWAAPVLPRGSAVGGLTPKGAIKINRMRESATIGSSLLWTGRGASRRWKELGLKRGANWGGAEAAEGETEAERYRAGRRRCVKDCDRALIFGDITTQEGRGFIRDCPELGKSRVHVQAGLTAPRHIAGFIPESRVSRFRIAGNR